ncbi:uncharacterized protein EDB93DRAFT_1109309 [Suillus bovinus]|uniref:uncharacterized protein n=1 Tax=Suillus bovinus TaxID=48563 RepID=UPI001B885719|nr:uncharacterized protein EDB93DRAFT_1109309 [Suillus bovinus]KAG2127453.1 hypothetical protein EDB93DRAFT_1109309 [Suillus bovinus]
MPTPDESNDAMGAATEKILAILSRAVKLKEGHPDHLKLAVEVREIMVGVPSPRPRSHTNTGKGADWGMEMEETTPGVGSIQLTDLPMPHMLKRKGKEKDVVLPGRESNCKVNRGQIPSMQKRKRVLSLSPPPPETGAHQPDAANTIRQTETSKQHKVPESPTSPGHNLSREDINADLGPKVPGSELVDVAPGRNLNVPMLMLMLSPCRRTILATHVLGHCAIKQQKQTSHAMPDTHSGSAVALTQQSMEVNNSGDYIVDELQAMTLLQNESVGVVAMNADLHEVVSELRGLIAHLQAQHLATTELVDTLNACIATQDINIHALQGLHTEVAALQDYVRTLQEESANRDESLWRAHEQIARQEHTSGILQDTYNSLRLCVTGLAQQLSAPFNNALYLANLVYGANQNMMPVSVGQMAAMKGLYLNLPPGHSGFGGPSIRIIPGGSGLGGPVGQSISNNACGASLRNIPGTSGLTGPSVGPSISQVASGSGSGGDTQHGPSSGVEPQS